MKKSPKPAARPTAHELIGTVELVCSHQARNEAGEFVPTCASKALLAQHGFLCRWHMNQAAPKSAVTHKIIRGDLQPITAEEILDADLRNCRADDLDLRQLRTKTLIGIDINVLAELLDPDAAEEN